MIAINARSASVEEFYIICPDNEVSSDLDAKRIR